jgi:hypothetical protein
MVTPQDPKQYHDSVRLWYFISVVGVIQNPATTISKTITIQLPMHEIYHLSTHIPCSC